MAERSSRVIAGAMSGTSADGVDVALVRIDGTGLEMSARLVHHHHAPYEAALRAAIFGCRNAGEIRLSDLASLARAISLVYARAVNDAVAAAGMKPTELAAVAA